MRAEVEAELWIENGKLKVLCFTESVVCPLYEGYSNRALSEALSSGSKKKSEVRLQEANKLSVIHPKCSIPFVFSCTGPDLNCVARGSPHGCRHLKRVE